MTVNDNKEVENDEVEGEVQLLTADLIREDLKLATNVEQFLTHDFDLEGVLKFQPKNSTEAVNYERNSSFESKATAALGISDTSTDDSILDPVRNKRSRLLSTSDE
ncbi:hypothetical protein TNCV_2381121 [Trichonephila clavipes]|nr:hypothetical protein TNCV_2381121 [Trichonephila clavipes]